MNATLGSSSKTMSALIILFANLSPSGAFLGPSPCSTRPAHASSACRQLRPSSASSASLFPKPWFVPSSALLATSKASGELPPSGDFSLFDPDAEGKLQGTGSLHERLRLGTDYGSTSPDISPALQELVELASPDDDEDEDESDMRKEEPIVEPQEQVNLGASMLTTAEPPVSAADTSAGVGVNAAGTDSTPPADGIVLELDNSGNTGNPIADPAKVQISQLPDRFITALDDVPARIQFMDTFAPSSSSPRIIKSLRIQLNGTPNHFQLIFSDPTGDGMKKRIEYQSHLLTAVKRYRIVKTWDLARRRLDQQSGVIGGIGGGAIMQAGSFQTTIQSGVVSASPSPDSTSAGATSSAADNTSTTIDVQFDPNGWLESINVNGRTIVTASGYLNSIYEELERFVCYPEMYLIGNATVQGISFY